MKIKPWMMLVTMMAGWINRYRIYLPDICPTGDMCYNIRKPCYQEGVIYGNTKQEA
jgi:hypothetical protein